ncbi:hypothetical protein CDD83_5911 [Cordyceps sp. RAO-2017]|nr:hypothetical protein CDD83_5911 [Cordyceps sp. RAO-2017]
MEDFDSGQQGNSGHGSEKRGWLHRLLRPSPNCEHGASQDIASPPCQLQVRHRRSVSDLANIIRSRREPPRILCIQNMVRLSGTSLLYLPPDYAPCSLILPTCLRATAQHLAQNAATRGLFRIPGSVRVVTALFDHYCYVEPGGDVIAATVRCANLPLHISYAVHDVASTFKKLLSVLPGGILGSLALFDAFVAIHSHLNGEPEFPRTKQTKVRARLIALAIGTVQSQFRRELICAVMGLLSLIGRVAEVTPREDQDGRPLPTGDLMGYSALGIVFGPLLVGELLDQYAMGLATPTAGMLLFPFSPRGFRDRRRTKPDTLQPGLPNVDKIFVANNIAEMLIANWRDVVRQMKALGAHHRKNGSVVHEHSGSLRPSISEPYAINLQQGVRATARKCNRSERQSSPEPDTPAMGSKGRRNKPLKNASSHRLLQKMSTQTLSPTREESLSDGGLTDRRGVSWQDQDQVVDEPTAPAVAAACPNDHKHTQRSINEQLGDAICAATNPSLNEESMKEPPLRLLREKEAVASRPQIYLDRVPPRVSSKSRQGRDSSETTHTFMSHQVGNSTNLSPTPAPARPGKARERDEDNAPIKLDSHECSEDSAATFYSLCSDRLCRGVEATGSMGNENTQLDRPSSPRGRSRAKAPTRYIAMPGIDGLVQRGSAHEPRQRSETESSGRAARGASRRSTSSAKTPRKTTDRQSEESQIAAAQSSPRRNSISSTPDRLYPLCQPRGNDRREQCHEPRKQTHGHERSPTRELANSPSRGSSAQALSKRGSVKVMAALFDSQGSIHQRIATQSKNAGSNEDALIETPTAPPCRCVRQSQVEPSWMAGVLDKSFASMSSGRERSHIGPRSRLEKADVRGTQSPGSLGTPVAGAIADINGESPQAEADRLACHLHARRSTPTLRHPETSMGTCEKLRPVSNLGVALPDSGKLLIAQPSRPLSTPPSASPSGEGRARALRSLSSASDVPRISASVLYSQVRSLQRHLSAKAEETAQLRRQIAAQEDSEVSTLSAQLNAARRDALMWKERAESAEKRIKMFEGFSARLRSMRDAMSEVQQRPKDIHDAEDDSHLAPIRKSLSQNGSDVPGGRARRASRAERHVDFNESLGDEKDEASENKEHPGDSFSRARRYLESHLTMTAAGNMNGVVSSQRRARSGTMGGDGAGSFQGDEGPDLMTVDARENIWAAAEELLWMMEDERVS